MKKGWKWFVKEFSEMLPAAIFFFVAFSLVDITEIYIHKNASTTYYSFLVVVTSALVMGKVVLISNHLPFISLFSHKPLIYSTLWKTFIYVMCSLVIRFIERLVPFFFEGKAWATVSARAVSEVEGLPFWLTQTWLIMLFLIFVAYQELICAVGEKKVRQMFFGHGKNKK